jgi:hypothetical protein
MSDVYRVLNNTLTQIVRLVCIDFLLFMSSNSDSLYQQFRQLLQQLQQGLAEPTHAQGELRTRIAHIQQLFQTQIVPLADAENGASSTQRQSIQIEINKQLRLLETDVIFLQAARQAATVQQRKQQMSHRLEILLQYCDACLALQSEESVANSLEPPTEIS